MMPSTAASPSIRAPEVINLSLSEIKNDPENSTLFLAQKPNPDNYDIYAELAYYWHKTTGMVSVINTHKEYLLEAAVYNITAATILFRSLILAEMYSSEQLLNIYKTHAIHPDFNQHFFKDSDTIIKILFVTQRQIPALGKLLVLREQEHRYMQKIAGKIESFKLEKIKFEIVGYASVLSNIMKTYEKNNLAGEAKRLQTAFAKITQPLGITAKTLSFLIGSCQETTYALSQDFNQHSEGEMVYVFHQLKSLVGMRELWEADISGLNMNLILLRKKIIQVQDKLEQDKSQTNPLQNRIGPLNQTQVFINADVDLNAIPGQFRCGLSYKVMSDPVYIEQPDGNKFYTERLALERYLIEDKNNGHNPPRNPVTQEPYDPSQIYEAVELKQEMEAFLQQHRSSPSISAAAPSYAAAAERHGLMSSSSSAFSSTPAAGSSSSSPKRK